MNDKILTKELAEQFLADDVSVDLSIFTGIEDDAAAVLGQFEGDLYLDSLVELSDTVASHLSRHRGELSLNGIPVLTENSARSLTTHQGPVSLQGIESLDGPVASIIQSLIWPHVPYSEFPTTYVRLPDFEEGRIDSGTLVRMQMAKSIQHLIDEVERVSEMLGNSHQDEHKAELNEALRGFSYSIQAFHNGGRITLSLAKTLKADFQNNELSQRALEDFLGLGFTIEDDAKRLFNEWYEEDFSGDEHERKTSTDS